MDRGPKKQERYNFVELSKKEKDYQEFSKLPNSLIKEPSRETSLMALELSSSKMVIATRVTSRMEITTAMENMKHKQEHILDSSYAGNTTAGVSTAGKMAPTMRGSIDREYATVMEK